MTCIEKIYSVSALIGDGRCNGKCEFCAAKSLRRHAFNHDSQLYWKNYESAIKLCARHGGWSLSLTSSGEPTVDPDSVTRALESYKKCADQGAYMPNVNLFTNGILLGDNSYCGTWMTKWRGLGLTNVAVSIHSVDTKRQAEVYGIDSYPQYSDIFQNISRAGVGVRATVLLRKGEIDCAEEYAHAVNVMISEGCNSITSWPIGNPNGSRNTFTPSRWGLFTIRKWLLKNAKLCHGHSWGGGVYDYCGSILRLTDYVTRHDPKKDFVRQLVVFQDSTVCYSWIKEGALCMK